MNNDIAIVGMSCRFPKASSLNEFWDLCWHGKSGVSDIPLERLNITKSFGGPLNAAPEDFFRYGGFIQHVNMFDASFFGITPREAIHIDPRQRLMLELSWEALEDGGIVPSDLAGSKTSVYIATLTDDYSSLVFSNPDDVAGHSGSAVANAAIANRLSYFYDFRGPSLTLDTACSGSLVAAHMACQGLRLKESDMALVGGVSIILSAEGALFFSRAGALSSTGKCNSFTSVADGFVRSDGLGLVVLQRLTDALDQNRRVYAVIKGSAVNQDGRTHGIMAPNPLAQQSVLEQAYENASVSPSNIQYVEAHGTGTILGDEVEASTLCKVLSDSHEKTSPCYIGTVKTNIGHTEAAAGVAGLIKTALSIYHRKIPMGAYEPELISKFPFEENGLKLLRHSSEWPCPEKPLTAGVSAFGFAGTNVHLVLSEPTISTQVIKQESTDNTPIPFLISAQCKNSLMQLAKKYAEFIDSSTHTLSQIAHAANVSREHLQNRLAIVASTKTQLIDALDSISMGATHDDADLDSAPISQDNLVFYYADDLNSSHSLLTDLLINPTIRTTLEKCDDLITTLTGHSLLDRLKTKNNQELSNKLYVTFSIQAAITDYFKSTGITPSYVIGCGVGEISAGYASGALQLEEAINIVHSQTGLIHNHRNDNKLLQVNASYSRVKEVLKTNDDVRIVSTHNSSRTIISVAPEKTEAILLLIEELEIFCKPLQDYDIDTVALKAALPNYLHNVSSQETDYQTTGPVFLSSIDSKVRMDKAIKSSYWYQWLTETADIPSAIKRMTVDNITGVLEIKVSSNESSTLNTNFTHLKRMPKIISTFYNDSRPWDSLISAICKLYTLGYTPNIFAGIDSTFISLPTYPWTRTKYWAIKDEAASLTNGKQESHDDHADKSIANAHNLDIGELSATIVSIIISVTRMPLNEKDFNVSLISLGIDSMMGIEINNRLHKDLGMRISAAKILGGITINSLIDHCYAQSQKTDTKIKVTHKEKHAEKLISTLIEEIKLMDQKDVKNELVRPINEDD